ncbi:RNA polymerase sigma factor [Virgibacillus sp. NKC19-3]|uniref:RNA polymerase sigma factor n=1 Tax=Virgibacillus saliphilus TaxID=2831674 RepID=UPI001C9A3647|nr:RNA polymerase sigma factor [Virgibacillus sp. NKC19-3]MBY7142646.1 RNA polymerase sigma factor [Virgibacillus sp. NKC19-3]
MISDEELIKDIKRGSKSSMDVLVRRYYKVVYALIYRSVFDKSIAYDLTQESFIKIIKNIRQYSEQGSLKNWMLTIASNQCRDYVRSKEAKSKSLSIPLEESRLETKDSPVSSVLERRENRKNIMCKMQQIPFEQRQAIYLKYFHDLKIREIAETTKTSASTVKSRLYSGLEKLEHLLERSSFYEEGDQ